MTSPNGHLAPGHGQSQPGGPIQHTPRKIIPLMPGVARPTGERRAPMREAVLQVIHNLVIESVPPSQRSPLFDQAADLLDVAGWGLDELCEAASEGSARDELLTKLGLLET
jgi:hypothetical protein